MAKSEESLTQAKKDRATPAAYVPFKTFLSSLEALEHGVPKQLDRTIWRSQSGVVQSQIMMALRFFGLVDEEDHPTQALHRFIENKDKRAEMVRALLLYGYSDIINHDLTKMTPKMLDEMMDAYHVSGETKRKAVTFFLQAARFAELPVHPLLSSQSRNVGTRRRRQRKDNGGQVDAENNTHAGSQGGGSGSEKTVTLRSGGTLSLSISVDVFSMSAEDRKFVFDLIDKLQAYGKVPASV